MNKGRKPLRAYLQGRSFPLYLARGVPYGAAPSRLIPAVSRNLQPTTAKPFMEWGVSFFLIGLFFELHASYVDLLGIAPSNYFFLTAFILNGREIIRYFIGHRKIQNYFLIFLLGSFSLLLADLSLDTPTQIRFLVKTLAKAPLLFLLTSFYAEKKSMLLLAKAFVMLMSPSLMVGLGQLFGLGFFWDLRRWIEPTSFEQDFNVYRITGLAQYFVEFALKGYAAFFCALLIFKKESKWGFSVLGILFVLLLGSLTRSYIYAVLICLTILSLFSKRLLGDHSMRKVAILCWSLFFAFPIFSRWPVRDLDPVHQREIARLISTDHSMGARFYMAIGAIKVWSKSPWLGVGSRYLAYEDLVKQVQITEVSWIPGFEEVYSQYSHNSFLNFLLAYGSFAFVVLLMFVSKVLRGLWRTQRTENLLLWFGLVGLLINACFHNSSLWDSTTGTFLLGLAISQMTKTDEDRFWGWPPPKVILNIGSGEHPNQKPLPGGVS